MKLLGFEITPGWLSKKEESAVVDPMDKYRNATAGHWGAAYSVGFDGEKNLGEIGPAINYFLNFDMLRIRSWQSYLESDLSKTIMNKTIIWIIDEGLKLQSSVDFKLLKTEGISIDAENFNETIESRFSTWANSKHSSFDGMGNLNTIAEEAFKNSIIGGDVLVVLRLIKGVVKIQLIDGDHVQTPFFNNGREVGNNISNGVEYSSTGEHIAYHVRTKDLNFERIPAKSKATGLTMAFLVYGSKYRLDNYRGLPSIATSLETLAKIERYKEAAVGAAEEREKIPYTIEHEVHSTGESPLGEQLAAAYNSGRSNNSDIPVDDQGNKMANTVAVSTNKQVFNMPIGAKLKSLESNNPMFFKEFYGTNADGVCSSIGIPPNVAFSIYNDSFSASRTATKDWEHTMLVKRGNFKFQFYQNIFNFFLHIQVLQNKIEAPGYLDAFARGDFMIVESYRRVRFTGAMFPHIDPVKEVKAEREKLGDTAKSIPLTTIERATEAVNGGDSASNMEQYANEYKRAKELEIISEEPVQEPVNPSE